MRRSTKSDRKPLTIVKAQIHLTYWLEKLNENWRKNYKMNTAKWTASKWTKWTPAFLSLTHTLTQTLSHWLPLCISLSLYLKLNNETKFVIINSLYKVYIINPRHRPINRFKHKIQISLPSTLFRKHITSSELTILNCSETDYIIYYDYILLCC